MADKVEKPKKSKAKPKKDEKGVLDSLPATRPQRIGTRRAPAPGTSESAAAAPATASTGRAKPAAEAKPAAKAKPAARSTPAAHAKPAAKATLTAKATAKAKPAAAPRATAAPPRPAEPRPRAVREGAPGMGTSERPRPSSEHGRPSGTELVSTAVKAAGELAQVGLAIGGQIIKRAVDRLPKP
jgi:hypothetical protein